MLVPQHIVIGSEWSYAWKWRRHHLVALKACQGNLKCFAHTVIQNVRTKALANLFKSPTFLFPLWRLKFNLLVRRFVATRVACPTSRAISSPDIFLPLRAHLRRPMNSPAPPSTLDRDGFESDGPDQSHSQARRGLRGPARPGPQGSCERVH